MSIQRISFKLFPKYKFLMGVNVQMHETFNIETEESYDGVDFEIGIGLLMFSITINKKRKGAN